MQAATAIDRAVILLAQTGEGRLEWVAHYHRLRVGRHDVALAIDRTAGTIVVVGIYRAR